MIHVYPSSKYAELCGNVGSAPKCVQVLRHLERALVAWVCRKYKRFRRRERAATYWLGGVARRDPHLMVLWQLGVTPAAAAGGAG